MHLGNVMEIIIYFAVNNEGSNKSDYFPNVPNFNVTFLFEDTIVIVR